MCGPCSWEGRAYIFCDVLMSVDDLYGVILSHPLAGLGSRFRGSGVE